MKITIVFIYVLAFCLITLGGYSVSNNLASQDPKPAEKKPDTPKEKKGPKPACTGPAEYPDFANLRKRIFGRRKKSKITGTDIVWLC